MKKETRELSKIVDTLYDIREMTYDQIRLLTINFNKWIILLAVLLSLNILGFIAVFFILG